MINKPRVLWLEDGARHDLAYLTAPIYMHGGFDLIVAENVSDGVRHVSENQFDALIVDIRLPPGDDPEWERLWRAADNAKLSARLGIEFLYTILGHQKAKVKLEEGASPLTADKVAVFTVESYEDLQEPLDELGIKVFTQKIVEMSDTILLELIQKVKRKSG